MLLKCLPRASKFGYRSKDADAGENSTTVAGGVQARASAAADSRSGTWWMRVADGSNSGQARTAASIFGPVAPIRIRSHTRSQMYGASGS